MDGSLVYVIDDDAAVRDSLVALFDAAGLPVRDFPSASAFLDVIDDVEAGCVVTDVCMPEVSGLDLLRRLNGRRSRFGVIVLTGEADVPMAVEALKNGALDFIEKPFAPEAIVDAVRSALVRLEGESDRTRRRREGAERMAALTAREHDVLGGLLEGCSNKEIARRLEISPRTVEAYRANVMTKMQAESLSELVRAALLARSVD
jgi:two-component system response regulator FixJ